MLNPAYYSEILLFWNKGVFPGLWIDLFSVSLDVLKAFEIACSPQSKVSFTFISYVHPYVISPCSAIYIIFLPEVKCLLWWTFFQAQMRF